MRNKKQLSLSIPKITILLCLVGMFCFFLGKKTAEWNVAEASVSSNTMEVTSPYETSQVPTEEPKVMVSDERLLRIDLIVDEDAQFTNIMPEQLGGNFDNKITYLDVRNVSIEIDGTSYHLEDAIRDGHISVEKIFAYARLDARNGFCIEKTRTHNGLTHFVYQYPQFDLQLTYDVYVTPDGKEHLINELYVCKNAYSLSTSYKPLDLEDWGVHFTVLDATPNALTLECNQSGGQQIGDLVIEYYYIENSETGIAVSPLKRITNTESYQPKSAIPRNAISVITIDWTDIYGDLPEGSYLMRLRIVDKFTPEQVHPLMQDFYDLQGYDIPFIIQSNNR